jgi:hypothetical protein
MVINGDCIVILHWLVCLLFFAPIPAGQRGCVYPSIDKCGPNQTSPGFAICHMLVAAGCWWSRQQRRNKVIVKERYWKRLTRFLTNSTGSRLRKLSRLFEPQVTITIKGQPGRKTGIDSHRDTNAFANCCVLPWRPWNPPQICFVFMAETNLDLLSIHVVLA